MLPAGGLFPLNYFRLCDGANKCAEMLEGSNNCG